MPRRSEPTPEQRAAMAKAQAAHLQHAAERAMSDPVAISRAARICREAIARGLLTPDLTEAEK